MIHIQLDPLKIFTDFHEITINVSSGKVLEIILSAFFQWVEYQRVRDIVVLKRRGFKSKWIQYICVWAKSNATLS